MAGDNRWREFVFARQVLVQVHFSLDPKAKATRPEEAGRSGRDVEGKRISGF